MQLPRPTSLSEFQALLDTFVGAYNQHRPHRALPHWATPATTYQARPKVSPECRQQDSHDRSRAECASKAGDLNL